MTKKVSQVAVVTKALQDNGVHPDTVSKTKVGTVIARWGFFYTHGMTADKKAAAVKKALETAGIKFEIVNSYEKWTSFNGGASIAKSSHWGVEISIQSLPEKLAGTKLYVMAAVLGVSNAGSDHLFSARGGPRAEFLPCDASELTRSQYCRSVDDATTTIVRNLCENDEMLEMFQQETRSWVKKLKGKTAAEIKKDYSDYSSYVDAVFAG